MFEGHKQLHGHQVHDGEEFVDFYLPIFEGYEDHRTDKLLIYLWISMKFHARMTLFDHYVHFKIAMMINPILTNSSRLTTNFFIDTICNINKSL